MAFVGIRDLNKNTKQVIETLVETREPVILTRQGRPIATTLTLHGRRLNDLCISPAPEFGARRDRAEQGFAAGETRSLGDVMTELRAERGVADTTDDAQIAIAVPAGRPYGAAFQAAAVERGRQLSKAIVAEAIADGALADEQDPSGPPEPLAAIDELNAKLYEIALAARRFRVIEATMQHVAESGATPADLDLVAEDHDTDASETASMQVRDINQSLLAGAEQKGGISLTEYVHSLQQVSSALETVGESAPDSTLPAAEA
jgi:antitoxin (DNA-binding transcriptional repressor) of toxin-antitoxin stability system